MFSAILEKLWCMLASDSKVLSLFLHSCRAGKIIINVDPQELVDRRIVSRNTTLGIH